VIVLLVALAVVGAVSVIAFGGLTALLRDDEYDDGRERLFRDTVTGAVVLAAGAVVIGVAVLALFVVGVAGLRG
jgi:hypothetical protein